MKALIASLAPMRTRADHSTYSAQTEGKSQHGRIEVVASYAKSRPGARIEAKDIGLPQEAALCAQYAVSRSVLREATRVLVAKGLVVSRQRAGAIVRPRNEWHLLDPDVLYWLIQSRP